jgi:hypothetical protein
MSDSYNYLFQIHQDWIFDRQITNSCLQILSDFQKLRQIFRERIEEKLAPVLTELAEQTAALKQNLEDPNEDLKKILLKQKVTVAKNISPNIISPLGNNLIELDFPGLLNSIMIKIGQAVETFDQEFWLTKEKSITENLKDSDFYLFKPKEIIEHEIMPKFQKGINEIKTGSYKKIDDLKKGIDNIDNILIFNLESAIETFTQDDEGIEKSHGLAVGGIDRALNKIEEVQQELSEFLTNTDATLRSNLLGFNREMQALSDNENAILLRIKLTKARTLQKTIKYRKAFLRKARFLGLRFLVMARQYSRKAIQTALPWQKRIGLGSSQSFIGTELSEFLSFAYEAIGKLPAIYQRLYSVKPLSDQELFVGRTAELRELRKAVESWENGGYAPTLIMGEKWSGRTSFINHFVEDFKNEFRFIRCTPTTNTCEPGDFYGLWEDWLSSKPIENFDQLSSHINTLPGKRCIIVEDIQNLFLRVNGGFQNVRLLLDLISATQENCLWICTITQYATDYLNNTIQLADYFGYLIKLREMKSEQITEVIMRRNNISGYRIEFLPAEKNLKSRSYLKLNENEKQQFLQIQFFKNLNNFSKSNISSALIYWLLSTKNISEDAIEIGHFDFPDFSFLGNLSHLKTLALHTLILHDGLNEELFIRVMDIMDIQGKRLLKLLVDDGVVIEKDMMYRINPLLYKPSVDMLRAKNFIY